MRVNLSTQPSTASAAHGGTLPITLTIRPAARIPGNYECSMDSAALLRLLRTQTDLPGYELEAFAMRLRATRNAQLTGVDLSDTVLTDIGYFID